jgi:hypothetical protein
MQDIFVGKIKDISPALLLGVLAGYCQSALVVESEIIRNQMRKHNRSLIVAMNGTTFAILPRKQ